MVGTKKEMSVKQIHATLGVRIFYRTGIHTKTVGQPWDLTRMGTATVN
jgi:hypothetical protein